MCVCARQLSGEQLKLIYAQLKLEQRRPKAD